MIIWGKTGILNESILKIQITRISKIHVIYKAMRSRFSSVRFFSVRSKSFVDRFGFFRFGQMTENIGSFFLGSV